MRCKMSCYEAGISGRNLMRYKEESIRWRNTNDSQILF